MSVVRMTSQNTAEPQKLSYFLIQEFPGNLNDSDQV